jgi:hypothetical protein
MSPSLLQAIKKSLPTKAIKNEVQLDKALYRLWRHLAAMPGLDTAPVAMKEIAREWFNRAKQIMVDDPLGDRVSVLARWRFDQAWNWFSSCLHQLRKPDISSQKIAEEAKSLPPPAAEEFPYPWRRSASLWGCRGMRCCLFAAS